MDGQSPSFFFLPTTFPFLILASFFLPSWHISITSLKHLVGACLIGLPPFHFNPNAPVHTLVPSLLCIWSNHCNLSSSNCVKNIWNKTFLKILFLILLLLFSYIHVKNVIPFAWILQLFLIISIHLLLLYVIYTYWIIFWRVSLFL